jgi:SAM-dependent methyltransferase
VARAFLVPQFGDRVQFLRADLEYLPLHEAVDSIFSTATFHWILDHRGLFRQNLNREGGLYKNTQCDAGLACRNVVNVGGWRRFVLSSTVGGPVSTSHLRQSASFVVGSNATLRVRLNSPDHRSLFQRLFHVLKPGGVLVAQCGGGPNLARLRQRTALVMEAPPYAPCFLDWSDPWLFADDLTTAARLRDTGFTEIETSLEPAPTAFATTQEFREFITTVFCAQHLERIPNEALRLQFTARLTEQAEQDTPPLVLDYWRLNLRGTRPAAL